MAATNSQHGFDAVIKSTKMGPTDILQPEQRFESLNLSVTTTCYILATLSVTRLYVSYPTDISKGKLLVNLVTLEDKEHVFVWSSKLVRTLVFIFDHWVHTQFIQNSCLPKGMDQSHLYSSLRFQPVPSHFVPIKDIESKILSGILSIFYKALGKIPRMPLKLSVIQHNHKHALGSNLPNTQIPHYYSPNCGSLSISDQDVGRVIILPRAHPKQITISKLLVWNLKRLGIWKQVFYVILAVHMQGFQGVVKSLKMHS